MAREMKDSGIEWIGEIPREWEVAQLKRFINVNNGREIETEVQDTNGAIPVYGSGGVFKYTNIPLFDGETVMFGRKGTLGKPIYANEKLWTVDTMYFLTFSDDIFAKFNYYQLVSFDWNPHITQTALPSVVGSEIVSCHFAFPPFSEQQSIADFLDTQCAHIDSVIEKTRAAIEEYKKLKQAVITQAVTKGIRPNREMKDSGIEWIGTMPKEWSLIPFRHVLNERNEKNLPVRSTERLSLSIDLGITLYSEKTTNLDRFKDDFEQYKLTHKGDLVMNSMNMIVGATGVSPYFGCVSPAYYTFYDNTENHVTAKLCEYIFRSKTMLRVLFSMGKGIYAIVRGDDRVNTCRLKVSREDLKSILLPIPSLDEQSEIVAYLDEKTAAIDSLIQKKEQLITELEAYKKSLIYEYVTGKKEVPDNKIISISVEFQIALLMCKILKNTDIKGRIHLQKVTYASDTLLDLFSETQYYRYPHGPYDLNIERYESIMESQGWVTVDKSKGYVRYTKTKRFIEFESQYQDVFKNRDNEIQKICTLFNVKRTSKAEKMATVLASWNDFLIDGVNPTDDMIINDIVTNWTVNKANISVETWREIIHQLKENQMIPKGYGKHTLKKEQNDYAH